MTTRADLHRGWEQRSCAVAGVELREVQPTAGLAGWTVRGVVSSYNNEYPVRDAQGEYLEVVRPQAFDSTLAAGCDCVFLLNHNMNDVPLARTSSGTMRLWSDRARGLMVEARLAEDNPTSAGIRSAISRGDLSAFSMSFIAEKQRWSSDFQHRELLGISLDGGDASIVSWPANTGTIGSAGLREADFAGESRAAKYSADDLRKLLKAGKAIANAAGEPSYPVNDKEDLLAAIRSVGRGSGDHDKIRAFIIKRAHALGLSNLIPENWRPDGSLSSADSLSLIGETRSPLHPRFLGSHSHSHPANGSQGGWRTHTHEHSHDGDASHAHSHEADVADGYSSDEDGDEVSSEALALAREELELRTRILRLRIGPKEWDLAKARLEEEKRRTGMSAAQILTQRQVDAIIAKRRRELSQRLGTSTYNLDKRRAELKRRGAR